MIQYFSLYEAVDTLIYRQSDRTLLAEVRAVIGKCPIPLGRYGFLARHIATFRFEDLWFAEWCQKGNLDPLWLEYTQDLFFPENPDKLSLVKLRIWEGKGRKDGDKVKVKRLIDPCSYDTLRKKPLKEIVTNNGENLVDFHHRLRQDIKGWGEETILDISNWLKHFGKAINYYQYYFMSMVVCGVLFEDFHLAGFPGLDIFRETVVVPAYESVLSKGLPPPLIVQHPPPPSFSEEEVRRFAYYPPGVLHFL